MAEFKTAYRITTRHEGGYVNDPLDKGEETYMGVARRFHAGWGGFAILDFYHTHNPRLKTGEFLPPKEQSWILPVHRQLFFDIWKQSRAGEISDQRLANIYYDFYIMTGNDAVKLLQMALNANGARLLVDGVIGPNTLKAANASNADRVHDTYKRLRAAFHKNAVNQGWVNRKFLPQWLKRNNTFPTLLEAGGKSWIIGLLIFAAAVAALLQGEYFNTKLKYGDYRNG